MDCFFGLITASHGVFDAMTNGGLGIAFFSPFDQTRYFFPVTPIEVSPIGIKRFVGPPGVSILWFEFLWILLPVSLVTLNSAIVRRTTS